MRPLSRVLQLQHGCPSQRKGANTAIEARLQVLSDVGLPPTTATKRSRRAGYYTNETRLHRVLKPCGLQQQQTASTGLSVFELRRGDALAPLYALAKFWLPTPQFGSIFGSSRTKPSFWILKALPPRSPDQVLLRELRSMEALGEIKRK